MPDASAIYDFLGKLLGAAPPQPQAQPTPGFGGIAGPPSPGVTAPQTAPGHLGLGDVLGSPGAQGALNAYFTLLSQPRYQGWGRGLGAAGLGGLQGFEAARQQQLTQPLLQAKMEEAQLGTQKAKRELAPLSPETVKALADWRTNLRADPKTTPQELALADTLESQARGGLLSNNEALDALMKWDQAKRDAELLRAQTGEMFAQYMPYFMNMFGLPAPAAGAPAGAGAALPSTPGATTPGAPAGAPPSAAASGGYPRYTAPPDFATVGAAEFKLSIPGKGDVFARYLTDDKTGKTGLYIAEGGTWRPMTP